MTTVLLLAAGKSRRFGPSCKLQAPYKGKPLVRHAADAIVATGLPAIAVVSDPAVADLLPEFRIVHANGPQSASLRAGLAQVATDRVLIALGDMPHVDTNLLMRVAQAIAPAAVTDGGPLGPPASFDRTMFPALLALSGDHGARVLLRSLPQVHVVSATPGALLDIDHADQISG